MTQLGFWLLFLFQPISFAGDAAEVRQNHAERADNQRDLADDRGDFRAINDIVDDWHRARTNHAPAAERAADQRLEAWMRRELAESRRDVNEAQREVGRSGAEVHASRAELGRKSGRGTPARAANARNDLADDRADRRDDQRDLAADRRDLSRTQEIGRQLQAIQPRIVKNRATPADYKKKSELLRELKRLAASEIGRDHRENHEDQRERREDHRERLEH